MDKVQKPNNSVVPSYRTVPRQLLGKTGVHVRQFWINTHHNAQGLPKLFFREWKRDK